MQSSDDVIIGSFVENFTLKWYVQEKSIKWGDMLTGRRVKHWVCFDSLKFKNLMQCPWEAYSCSMMYQIFVFFTHAHSHPCPSLKMIPWISVLGQGTKHMLLFSNFHAPIYIFFANSLKSSFKARKASQVARDNYFCPQSLQHPITHLPPFSQHFTAFI